jgi:hypothetical protein
MFRRKWMTGAAALLLGAGLASTMSALPALGQNSPPSAAVKLLPTGKIVARGAVADISVRVFCPAGDSAGISIQLNQNSGKTIVGGQGSGQTTCTGQAKTVTVKVLADVGGRPFVAKTTYSQATLEVCTISFTCNFSNAARVVKLTK